MLPMFPRLSHVFLGVELVEQNVALLVDSQDQKLKIVPVDGAEQTFNVKDVNSLEFCYHQTGRFGAPVYEALAVLRFATEQNVSGRSLPTLHPIVMVVRDAFASFRALQEVVICYERLLSPEVVKLLAFTQWPVCVKEVVPLVARPYLLPEQPEDAPNVNVQPQPQNRDAGDIEVVQLDSDDEDDQDPPTPTYHVEGNRLQIADRSLHSLSPGVYLDDEMINMSLLRVTARHPEVHIFTSLETTKIFNVFHNKSFYQAKQMSEQEFYKKFREFFYKKMPPNRLWKKKDLSETFLSKKTIIFPTCHNNHWVMLVFVNPLLADATNLCDEREAGTGHKPAAYFLDSLKGTHRYATRILMYRMEQTWRIFFSFIRLAAWYHDFSYIDPSLIECTVETNLPPQVNNFDCGAHLVVNARQVAEMSEDLMNGPKKLTVDAEKVREMARDAATFRVDTKAYLAGCRQ